MSAINPSKPLATPNSRQKEFLRKHISNQVDSDEFGVAVWIRVSGSWIISAGIEKALMSLFPERFKYGINANQSYDFTPENAEYAGFITKA